MYMCCNNYELDTIPARTVIIMFFVKRTTMQALQEKETFFEKTIAMVNVNKTAFIDLLMEKVGSNGKKRQPRPVEMRDTGFHIRCYDQTKLVHGFV